MVLQCQGCCVKKGTLVALAHDLSAFIVRLPGLLILWAHVLGLKVNVIFTESGGITLATLSSLMVTRECIYGKGQRKERVPL